MSDSTSLEILDRTTKQLWPHEAKQILDSKNVNIKKLKKNFKHIYFPWTQNYDFNRNYYSLRIQQRPLFIIEVTNTNEIELILKYSSGDILIASQL